jgi:elongation factor Ts
LQEGADEANGDMEAAVDWLRAKGLAAAAKKSSRTAAEGLVGVAVAGTKGVAVEVNSETDFVAKNDQFQDFVRKTTSVALAPASPMSKRSSSAAYPGGGTVPRSSDQQRRDHRREPAAAPHEAPFR